MTVAMPATIAAMPQLRPLATSVWTNDPEEERTHRLRMQTECDNARSVTTSGLVAYVDGSPAGWSTTEPRPACPGLTRQVALAGRPGEASADPGIWAVTCMVTALPYRWQGLTHALVAPAVQFARDQGAPAAIGIVAMVARVSRRGLSSATWVDGHLATRVA